MFSHILSARSIKKASAGTNEPAYLSSCLDRQKNVSINSYLFHDNEQINLRLKEFKGAVFRSTLPSDVDKVESLFTKNVDNMDMETIEMSYGDLTGYIDSLVEQEQLFVLFHNDTLLGIGECRISISQPPYADLGMVVAKNYRKKGLGSFILSKLKQHCYSFNIKPICSCSHDNIASKKAIEKTGFVSKHRILNIDF